MNNLEEFYKKYSVYLESLRSRLLFLTKLFVLLFAVGFFATSPILKFILSNISIKDVTVVTTSPFQLVNMAMSAGFFLACVLTVPILLYYCYLFVSPALLPKEKKFFRLAVPVGILLFCFGFVYGILMLYGAVGLIASVNVGLGVANYWDIGGFLSQMVFTSSLLGLLFLFPLVLTFLIRLGLVGVDFLSEKRRHAYVGIFVVVALLPPTDGLSLILMAVPLVLIFEITIILNRKFGTGRNLTNN